MRAFPRDKFRPRAKAADSNAIARERPRATRENTRILPLFAGVFYSSLLFLSSIFCRPICYTLRRNTEITIFRSLAIYKEDLWGFDIEIIALGIIYILPDHFSSWRIFKRFSSEKCHVQKSFILLKDFWIFKFAAIIFEIFHFSYNQLVKNLQLSHNSR